MTNGSWGDGHTTERQMAETVAMVAAGMVATAIAVTETMAVRAAETANVKTTETVMHKQHR